MSVHVRIRSLHVCMRSVQVCIGSLQVCMESMQVCIRSLEVCMESMHVCMSMIRGGGGCIFRRFGLTYFAHTKGRKTNILKEHKKWRYEQLRG